MDVASIPLNTPQEKMFNILEETKHFFNINNRAKFDKNGGQYLDSYGKRCAVGRYLNPTDILFLHEHNWLDCCISEVWGHLETPMIKELPLDFWEDIQWLHDCDELWGENGLSDRGILYYSIVKNKIEEGLYEKAN